MRRVLLFVCAFLLLSVPYSISCAEPEAAGDTPAAATEAQPAAPQEAKPSEPQKPEEPAATPTEQKAETPPPAEKAEQKEPEKTEAKPETPPAETKAEEKQTPKTDAKEESKPDQKADKKTEPEKKPKKFSKKSAKKTDEEAKKKPLVAVFTLKGEYPETHEMQGLFNEFRPTLTSLIQRLDAAAKDENVKAVLLKIEELSIGRGKIQELRAAVARLRKANKPVYAELNTADSGQYLLASACEKIAMPPSGMLFLPGVRAEVTFYKGLLDKLGLQFDALQMGKYKGAAEPLTRDKMSEPLRESFDAMVDDIYDDLVSTIASERRQTNYQVKMLMDQAIFTAEAAKKAGLVDELLYADQIEDEIKKSLKLEEVEFSTTYKKKRIETDFSGFSGMMKLMEVMMGGKPSESTSKKQKIAVVYAVGPIMEGKSDSNAFGSSTMGSTTIVSALKTAADDEKVAAIVLRIDSPGGSAVASDLIWRETVRIKKPIVASMSDIAASGGYYIAMGADKIIAAPGTLTGSIGVIGGKLVTRGLFDKLGMNVEVISRGANSGSFSSTQPFTENERKVWTELLQETYKQFVSKAAEGRKMPFEKLDEMAQGRIYTGRMAKNLGLVDELGTLDDAIAAAKAAAGLAADADVELMVLPKPRTFFEQLFGDPSASSDLESLLPEGFNVYFQAKMFRELLSERVLLWMPYGVELK